MARKQKDDTPDVDGGGNSASVAGAQLRALIERIERMEEEKKGISDDIRDVYSEGKAPALFIDVSPCVYYYPAYSCVYWGFISAKIYALV